MKTNFCLLLTALFLSSMVWAEDKTSLGSKSNTPSSIEDELNGVQEKVEKEFGYKFPETSDDLIKVKKAALVLVKASGHIDASRGVRVYWKKTKIEDEKNLKKGYLFLIVDSSAKTGVFATFWAGQKVSDVLDLGMKGLLKIKNKIAECDDCEGGLWSQTYIEKVANKLLKRKPFNMPVK